VPQAHHGILGLSYVLATLREPPAAMVAGYCPGS